MIDLTGPSVRVSLRVLMIAPVMPQGAGPARASAQLARALAARDGLELSVARLVHAGEPAIEDPRPVVEVNPAWPPGAGLLVRHADTADVVVVYVGLDDLAEGIVPELMERTAKPVVLVVDDVTSPAGHLRWKASVDRASAVVVRSHAAAGRPADILPVLSPPTGSELESSCWNRSVESSRVDGTLCGGSGLRIRSRIPRRSAARSNWPRMHRARGLAWSHEPNPERRADSSPW